VLHFGVMRLRFPLPTVASIHRDPNGGCEHADRSGQRLVPSLGIDDCGRNAAPVKKIGVMFVKEPATIYAAA
jgi:hypothetical protein